MKQFVFKHHKLGILDRVVASSYAEASEMVGVGFMLFVIHKL